MKDLNSSKEVKKFLLSDPDIEDDIGESPRICYALAWKKDHWIIRANNKRVGMIVKKDIPEGMNLKSNSLVFGSLKVLREASRLIEFGVDPLEELNKYLVGFHE
jgi:hypothetical protein